MSRSCFSRCTENVSTFLPFTSPVSVISQNYVVNGSQDEVRLIFTQI